MHMVDLQRTDEEKSAARMESMMPSVSDMPDVPYGLCNCFTERELEMLELDDNVQVGDYLHGRVMWKVTAVNKSDTGDGMKCRVEAAIVAMEVEDESTEMPGEDEDDD
jgi:hypothetical protein